MVNTITLLTFCFYLAVMLFVGWLGYRATHNLSDYILGGRRLGSVVTGLSTGASDMSAWLLMGLPGTIYRSGLRETWSAIGLLIGAWLNWQCVASRLRLYTEKCGNALTLPDYLSNRFEDRRHTLAMICALIMLFFFTIYCTSGVVAGARLFENLFGLPYSTARWAGALATIIYVFIGGFLAVSWTDTIQASLMITALILTPLMAVYASGDPSHSFPAALHLPPHYTDLFALDSLTIVSLLAWGLGYFGQPHILVRFMAAQSSHTIPTAKRIAMTWMLLCLTGAIAVGFFGFVYFNSHPQLASEVTVRPETVFIELVKQLFNPWMTGLLLAAVLAAIMSTLSCQLLICASTLTQDIYKTWFRHQASQRELLYFSRAMVLLVTLISIGLASNPDNQILKIVSYAWAGFGAAFGPVILLSLFWSRMTRQGALAGMLTGSITVLLWKHYAWFSLYEIVPGFVLATLAIIGMSLLSPPPSLAIRQQFNDVQETLQKTQRGNT